MNIINYPLIEPENQAKIGGFFMEKNECAVPLTKAEFVDIMNRLKEATILVDKVEELFRNSRENLECDFCNGAGLQISHEGIVVKLLEKLMKDCGGTISYFIYELDYGKEYQAGCMSDENGDIDISTSEKVYDYLMLEYEKATNQENEKEQ